MKKNLEWENSKCISTDGAKNYVNKMEEFWLSFRYGRRKLRWFKTINRKCFHMSEILKQFMLAIDYIKTHSLYYHHFCVFTNEIILV